MSEYLIHQNLCTIEIAAIIYFCQFDMKIILDY